MVRVPLQTFRAWPFISDKYIVLYTVDNKHLSEKSYVIGSEVLSITFTERCQNVVMAGRSSTLDLFEIGHEIF